MLEVKTEEPEGPAGVEKGDMDGYQENGCEDNHAGNRTDNVPGKVVDSAGQPDVNPGQFVDKGVDSDGSGSSGSYGTTTPQVWTSAPLHHPSLPGRMRKPRRRIIEFRGLQVLCTDKTYEAIQATLSKMEKILGMEHHMSMS